MRLVSLQMKNFMPFRGETVLNFPQDTYRNVMVVFGDNMRGKTSLLNALRWGFYGKALGRHSREVPLKDIPNRDAALEGDWDVEVVINFDANGKRYELRRTVRKHQMVADPRRDSDFVVAPHLRIDGIPVQGDQIKPEVNRVVPEQVSRFFLFDGELLQEYEALLMENSTQGEQIKEAIERVLGVPTIVNARNDLSVISKRAQRKQGEQIRHSTALKSLAEKQSQLIDQQELLEADLDGLAVQLEDVREQRIQLDDAIEGFEGVMADAQSIKLLQQQQSDLEDAIRRKESEQREVLAGAWEDLLAYRVNVKLGQLRRELRTVEGKIAQHRHREIQIQQLRRLLEEQVCPTCNQPHPPSERSRIGKELGQLEAESGVPDFADDLAHAITLQIAGLSGIHSRSSGSRIGSVNGDLRRAEVDLTKCENRIEELRDRIKDFDTAELSRKRAIRDGHIKEEERLRIQIDEKRRSLDKVKNDITITQKTIQGTTGGRAERATKLANLCSELEQIFATSVDRFRDVLRDEVEDKATSAFEHLTTQTTYAGLRINQNYGLTIVDEKGNDVTIRSAGAEQIVALSLIDGLNRTGKAIGPVIMDTPFGRLDLNHRDNILSYFPEVTTQLAMLVHSGEIRQGSDLDSIKSRIDSVYEIIEVNSRHSRLERISL